MVFMNKDRVIKYLIIFLPITLIFSIFFTELFLLIITIFFIKDNISEKKNYKNFFLIFLFLFVLYISFSSISFDQGLNFKSYFFYFRFLLYFFAIIYYLKKINIYNSLLKSFTYTAIILIIDGTIQFLFGVNIVGLEPEGNRISSFFGEELILGSYLVRLLPFFLIFFVHNFKNRSFFKLAFILSLSFMVLLSGERTAIFLLFLTFFIIFIFIKEYRKSILFSLTFIIFILSILVNFNEKYHERYVYNLLNSFGLINYKDKISLFDENNKRVEIFIFSKQHEAHYLTAYKMFQDKYIFGHGLKSFRVLCKDEKYNVSELSCATHPHNISMQFLAELGLVGFSFLLIFHILLISELIKINKYNKDNKEKKILLFSIIGIIINIFPFIPSGNFFNNWLSIILILNLVNYIYHRNKYLNV
jgi:O-antigen ligase